MLTEQSLADSAQLDRMSITDAVALFNQQDALAVAAVGQQRQAIAAAVAMVANSLRNGGRLVYFGAGTSGRLGVLDAAECPPTFRTDPQMIQAIIAGGPAAILAAQEGAEDSDTGGAAAVDALHIGPNDVAFGIAAGGTTPFVHGALRRAAERAGHTVFLTCVQPFPNEPVVDVVIRPLTGPEIITGSTRLKAGTATKLVLNTISTLVMVQLGKVHGNLMVDLRATNNKLWDRGTRLVATLTGLESQAAAELLRRADGHVKAAVVMQRHTIDLASAQQILARHKGRLRDALA